MWLLLCSIGGLTERQRQVADEKKAPYCFISGHPGQRAERADVLDEALAPVRIMAVKPPLQ